MIPLDCKKFMKNIKKSFLQSIEADINNVLIKNEIKFKQEFYDKLPQKFKSCQKNQPKNK